MQHIMYRGHVALHTWSDRREAAAPRIAPRRRAAPPWARTRVRRGGDGDDGGGAAPPPRRQRRPPGGEARTLSLRGAGLPREAAVPVEDTVCGPKLPPRGPGRPAPQAGRGTATEKPPSWSQSPHHASAAPNARGETVACRSRGPDLPRGRRRSRPRGRAPPMAARQTTNPRRPRTRPQLPYISICLRHARRCCWRTLAAGVFHTRVSQTEALPRLGILILFATQKNTKFKQILAH